jgi:hypothetical protein
VLIEGATGAPATAEEGPMKYALLIYENESVYGDKRGDPTQAIVQRHMAFGQELGDQRLGGMGLKNTDSATTVRTTASGVQTVHDGPFAETKEQLGGFYLVEAPDLDAAIEIARRVPLHTSGSIEVRPVLSPG